METQDACLVIGEVALLADEVEPGVVFVQRSSWVDLGIVEFTKRWATAMLITKACVLKQQRILTAEARQLPQHVERFSLNVDAASVRQFDCAARDLFER